MHREPLSVLIVDDEETFARILAEQLRDEYGFQTVVVSSGREAIEILQSTRRGFDALLLDYMMPEVTGLNVLQWMYEQKNETPVILLTAAGSETVAVEAMKLGAYDYLRKEYVDLPRIALAIQSVHERHQFRIAKMMEEERWKEIGLNRQATDKVRDVLNAITPKLNETFAEIATILERDAERVLATLPHESQQRLRAILGEIQKQTGSLEIGVRGLLGLYRILYARHTEVGEIERIKAELERNIVPPAP
jgi:DNA-binding NtrC family response regulator